MTDLNTRIAEVNSFLGTAPTTPGEPAPETVNIINTEAPAPAAPAQQTNQPAPDAMAEWFTQNVGMTPEQFKQQQQLTQLQTRWGVGQDEIITRLQTVKGLSTNLPPALHGLLESIDGIDFLWNNLASKQEQPPQFERASTSSNSTTGMNNQYWFTEEEILGMSDEQYLEAADAIVQAEALGKILKIDPYRVPKYKMLKERTSSDVRRSSIR